MHEGSAMNDDEGLGGRFWLMLVGGAIGAVLVGGLFLWLFGRAWYAWGFFGAFLMLCAALLAFGWVYDRRERRKRLAA
jgi:membrane protein implicated in regulation of membrane protease activity